MLPAGRPVLSYSVVQRTSYEQLTRARRPRRVNLSCARCFEPRVHFRSFRRQPVCQGRSAAMSSKVSALLSCARLCAAAAHSSLCTQCQGVGVPLRLLHEGALPCAPCPCDSLGFAC